MFKLSLIFNHNWFIFRSYFDAFFSFACFVFSLTVSSSMLNLFITKTPKPTTIIPIMTPQIRIIPEIILAFLGYMYLLLRVFLILYGCNIVQKASREL